MALEQVMSDRDSEDEVDDDIADFEDRRVCLLIMSSFFALFSISWFFLQQWKLLFLHFHVLFDLFKFVMHCISIRGVLAYSYAWIAMWRTCLFAFMLIRNALHGFLIERFL